MEDLIKRSDAIKAIEDRRCWLTLASQHGDMGRVLWDEYYIKFEDAIDALMLIPSADRPQEWIPCSERLPKENTEVLMSLEWGVDIGVSRMDIECACGISFEIYADEVIYSADGTPHQMGLTALDKWEKRSE